MNYPIVKFPNSLIEALTAEIIEPKLKKIDLPKEKEGLTFLSKIIIIGAIAFAIFISIKMEGKIITPGVIFILIIISFFLTPLIAIIELTTKLIEHKINKSKVAEIKKYNKEVDETLKRWKNPEYRKDLRKKKITPSLFIRNEIFPNKDNINIGKGELSFYFDLKKRFGKDVLINKKVGANEKSNFFYYPDFILILNNIIHFDIEIDEPYVISSKKPIHHIDSSDSNRDTWFTTNNWIVIRFTEKQTIFEREKCLDLIEQIANKILVGEQSSLLFDTEGNYVFHNLTKEKKWTIDEAETMAKNKVRENYFEEVRKHKKKVDFYENLAEHMIDSYLKDIKENPIIDNQKQEHIRTISINNLYENWEESFNKTLEAKSEIELAYRNARKENNTLELEIAKDLISADINPFEKFQIQVTQTGFFTDRNNINKAFLYFKCLVVGDRLNREIIVFPELPKKEIISDHIHAAFKVYYFNRELNSEKIIRESISLQKEMEFNKKEIEQYLIKKSFEDKEVVLVPRIFSFD